MQFVLNSNPLPINSHTNPKKKGEGLQYYEWKYKQKVLQEEKEQKILKKYLESIEKQQQQQEEKQQINKKKAHYQGTFYGYNLEWKRKIEDKIEQQKSIKKEQIAKSEGSLMKKQAKEEKKQMLREYKGPVQGWQQHFQNYIKSRSIGLTTVPQQATFEPKINEKSKKIAEGMYGKVQDRLILFGEFCKMKIKEEQINKMNEQTGNTSGTKFQKYFSNPQNQAELFLRLYKEAQQSTKKRRDMPLDDNHTFKPKTNKLPQEIQDKIMKRRKPLYYLKSSLSETKQQKNDESNKKVSKGDFASFMKRNQALLDMKKKMLVTMREKMEEKQNLQRSKCTFAPSLNNKSLKLNKSVKIENRQFEQKMLSDIKSLLEQENLASQNLQNIDISKLTEVEHKDNEESDSLSIYKIDIENKEGSKNQKIFKKQKQFDTTKGQLTDREITQMRNTKFSKGEQQPATSIQKTSRAAEEDSIQNMKNHDWQLQLQQIESHLQNMMSRASK